MVSEQLKAETQAFQSLTELLQKAEDCRRLFDLAHMALPEPLKRILAVGGNANSNGSARSRPTLVIPPPDVHSKPPEASPDWIFIQADQVTTTALVLAVIREAKRPIRHKEIIARVTKLSPNLPSGSISNVGTRLFGKIIDRAKEGWTLIDETSAPVLHNGWVWGPAPIFDKQDLAAHRRDAVLHLLGCNSGGLQLVQIVEQLRNCDWVKAPVNKDLLKADLDVLAEAGKIKRRGNSKKWEIAQKKE
jgi:hypothetical protein